MKASSFFPVLAHLLLLFSYILPGLVSVTSDAPTSVPVPTQH